MMPILDALTIADRWRERWPAEHESTQAFAALAAEVHRLTTQEQADKRLIRDLSAELEQHQALPVGDTSLRRTG